MLSFNAWAKGHPLYQPVTLTKRAFVEGDAFKYVSTTVFGVVQRGWSEPEFADAGQPLPFAKVSFALAGSQSVYQAAGNTYSYTGGLEQGDRITLSDGFTGVLAEPSYFIDSDTITVDIKEGVLGDETDFSVPPSFIPAGFDLVWGSMATVAPITFSIFNFPVPDAEGYQSAAKNLVPAGSMDFPSLPTEGAVVYQVGGNLDNGFFGQNVFTFRWLPDESTTYWGAYDDLELRVLTAGGDIIVRLPIQEDGGNSAGFNNNLNFATWYGFPATNAAWDYMFSQVNRLEGDVVFLLLTPQ